MLARILGHEFRQELWHTILSNRRRTIMTSIGVFSGMFFFTLFSGIGNGFSNALNESIEGTTISDLSIIISGKTTLPYEGYRSRREVNVTYGDFQYLKQNAKTTRHLEYITSFSSGDLVNTTINEKSYNVKAFGISNGYERNINHMKILAGRFLTNTELQNDAPVCVIGKTLVSWYFDKDDTSRAIGKYALMNGRMYLIVGVVDAFNDGYTIIGSIPRSIFISAPSMHHYDPQHNVFLAIAPKEGISENKMLDEVLNILKRRHHVHPDDKNAIFSVGMKGVVSIFDKMDNLFNVIIWIFGLGTFLTGIISVSNILLVTIRERRKEIGTRRALGATPRDIRIQFIGEAILIVFLAGIAGLAFALCCTLIYGNLAESIPDLARYAVRPYPTIWTLLFSLLLMIGAGVLAGLLPVHKALQITAREALSEE